MAETVAPRGEGDEEGEENETTPAKDLTTIEAMQTVELWLIMFQV